MFEVYCPAHESRVLLTTGRIEHLRNTASGVVIGWRCWCGQRGQLRPATGEVGASTAEGAATATGAAAVVGAVDDQVTVAGATGPDDPVDRSDPVLSDDGWRRTG